jgi:hypothetical protein
VFHLTDLFNEHSLDDAFIHDQTRILLLKREEIESIKNSKQLVDMLENKFVTLGLKKRII